MDLKKFRKQNAISQQELAEYLGVGQSFISQIERGVSPLPESLLEKIKANSDWTVAIDTLVNSGEINVHVSENNPNSEKLLPLLPFDAIAGPGTFQFQDTQIEDYYRIGVFANSDFLVRVSGDSMAPKYAGGDIIACKIIDDILFFQWGRVYVINTRSQGVMLKRLMPANDDNYITCVSYNQDYPPFDIPKEDIIKIALVKGSILVE